MKKSILFLTALALITINSAFDFGNDPNKQNFRKMTVSYRDFQGGNKEIYKLEEVIKNDKGWVVSHFYYNETGQLIAPSHSFVYDNNGNIKERKDVAFEKSKNKDVTISYTYINSFTDGKLKRTIITNKDNVAKNDTIDYIYETGVVAEKKSSCNGNGTDQFYNGDGKVGKEHTFVKNKLSITKIYEYGANGLSSITGINATGKEIEKFTWEYNDKGKLIKENRTFEDASKNFSAIYTYNTKAQMSGEERVDGGKKNLIVYEYDDKGMISKISVKNEKAIRNNERTYVYE